MYLMRKKRKKKQVNNKKIDDHRNAKAGKSTKEKVVVAIKDWVEDNFGKSCKEKDISVNNLLRNKKMSEITNKKKKQRGRV